MKTENPKYHYKCLQIQEPIKIDGNLNKQVWINCKKSPRFGDIVDGKPGLFNTQVALCWDLNYLYVAFWIEEPFLAANLTNRDDRVYLENDIEIFISGKDCYYEFEINALGTIYEVLYIPQNNYKKPIFQNNPEFNLLDHRVDVLGGFQDQMRFSDHHSIPKWAFRDWDFPGLQAKVQLQGTINDHSDVDQGWTVEIAFPWEGLKIFDPEQTYPPQEGQILRMDFSRFEKFSFNGKEIEPHPGWTWSPHGVYDSHLPEKFTYIHFSTEEVKNQ